MTVMFTCQDGSGDELRNQALKMLYSPPGVVNIYILLAVLVCSINLLLAEREGRTGEYCPEVVAVRRGPFKNDRGPIFPSAARAG